MMHKRRSQTIARTGPLMTMFAAGFLHGILSLQNLAIAEERCNDEKPSPSFVIPDVEVPFHGHLFVDTHIYTPTSEVESLKEKRTPSFRGMKFVLTAKPSKSISTTIRVLPGTLLELTPDKPLSPSTKYTLTLQTQQADSDDTTEETAPKRRKWVSESLGEFLTSASRDEASPSGQSVLGGKFLQVETTSGSGERSTIRYARLTQGNMLDDAGPLVYYVWISTSGQPIDYRKTPSTVVAPTHGGLEVGELTPCTKNFKWPSPSRKHATVTVGVKAVDYAGHESAQTEIQISQKLTKKLLDPSLDEQAGVSVACPSSKPAFLPSNKTDVPLNAQLRLQNIEGSVRLLLDKKEVPTEKKEEGPVIAIVPKAPLLPKKRYVLVDQAKHTLLSFSTGEHEVIGDPMIELGTATLVTKTKRVRGSDEPFLIQAIEIPVISPSTDQEPTQLWFEIWSGPSYDLVDVSKSPEAVLSATNGTLLLGDIHPACGYNFYIPPELDQLYLAIRAIDGTGHLSPMVRMSVDISKTKRVPMEPWVYSENEQAGLSGGEGSF